MTSNLKVHRGEIWFVNLDPTTGHEQAKLRPCIVISIDLFNQGGSELAVIIPITSKFKTVNWNIELRLAQGSLAKISYAICNQPRTVSLKRFKGKCLGTINSATLNQIEQRLRILLSL